MLRNYITMHGAKNIGMKASAAQSAGLSSSITLVSCRIFANFSSKEVVPIKHLPLLS